MHIPHSSSSVSILFLFPYCHLLSVSPVLPPPLSQHLWMISRVGWKQEEDTGPALHIHPSFCSFYSAICSLQSLSLLSVRFPCVLSVCQHSSSPLRWKHTTIYSVLSLSVPYCTASPPAPPLHPIWSKWTLCSKINFEINEAMAVCACSMIFCQKCSEGYVLIYLLPRHSTFVSCSFHDLCSGV